MTKPGEHKTFQARMLAGPTAGDRARPASLYFDDVPGALVPFRRREHV